MGSLLSYNWKLSHHRLAEARPTKTCSQPASASPGFSETALIIPSIAHATQYHPISSGEYGNRF
ncbi:MAG: hypothetical protein IPK82_30860 [Polyangiaceae bacterium]|nr:hypothetical protein [Polyangiaceae bacterium]